MKKLGKGVEGKLRPWGDPACWSHRTAAGPGTRTSALPGPAHHFSTDLCSEALCPYQQSHSCPKLSRRFPVSAEIVTAPFGGWGHRYALVSGAIQKHQGSEWSCCWVASAVISDEMTVPCVSRLQLRKDEVWGLCLFHCILMKKLELLSALPVGASATNQHLNKWTKWRDVNSIFTAKYLVRAQTEHFVMFCLSPK